MMKLSRTYLLASILFIIPVIVAASENRYDIPIEGSPSWGPANALVTIVEFIDYQ